MMNINPMSLVTLALLGALGGCSQQSVPPMNMAGADVITTDTTNTIDTIYEDGENGMGGAGSAQVGGGQYGAGQGGRGGQYGAGQGGRGKGANGAGTNGYNAGSGVGYDPYAAERKRQQQLAAERARQQQLAAERARQQQLSAAERARQQQLAAQRAARQKQLAGGGYGQYGSGGGNISGQYGNGAQAGSGGQYGAGGSGGQYGNNSYNNGSGGSNNLGAGLLAQRIVYFDYDQATIKPQYMAVLDAHANYLRSHPNAQIRLEGHADDRGSREYNLALSERRSRTVRDYMAVKGGSGSQMNTVGYGEEMPVKFGEDESSWAQNRRVEIKYTGE